jgi:hypothetical protein
MNGTVCEVGPGMVWVQLDGDCRVPLLPDEFSRKGGEARPGMRVEVAVGDIHPSLVRIIGGEK